MLENLDMKNCKAGKTSLALEVKVMVNFSGLEKTEELFREMIGMLDIIHAVNHFSHIYNNDYKIQWIRGKRILRYLAGASTYGYCTKGCTEAEYVGFTSAVKHMEFSKKFGLNIFK